MPELPEVEIVRRSMADLITGKTIKRIEVLYPRIVRTPSDVEEFKLLLVNQTLDAILRKGKYLLFKFSDVTLVSHLRMEGKYIYNDRRSLVYSKHTHVIFIFTDNSELLYNDVRKFGTMDAIWNNNIDNFPNFTKLGQEPIDPNFDVQRFTKEIKKKNAPIKQVLLNQDIVCGLGNIYVDDSLAMSGIHPLRKANSLTIQEIDRLIESMNNVLNEAIIRGGSSIRTFESIYGKGSMQDHLIVYGRADKPCIYCGTTIKKIKVGGRGTHYCPKCQELK